MMVIICIPLMKMSLFLKWKNILTFIIKEPLSLSGSHERYKSKERLEWAKENDCLVKFKQWILSNNNASLRANALEVA